MVMLKSFLAAAFFFTLYWPGTQPDTTLIAQLQAAQEEMHGKNGYQALFLRPSMSKAERAGSELLHDFNRVIPKLFDDHIVITDFLG